MSAKEILEKDDLHNTYWGKIIIQAAKTGEISDVVFGDASDWQMCACGKAQAHIEVIDTVHREPVDAELRSLGHKFTSAIITGAWEQAAELIVAIEKRAREVSS